MEMVETVGGYDYKYITEVPEDLICSLCHFPFKNPVHIEECGHIYCKECFQQTKDHAAENALNFCCPLDRQKVDVTRVFKDKFNERRVLSLKVECRNLPDGCSWAGELRDAIDHEGKCGKNEKLAWERFAVELKNMSSCMKDLEIQVKRNKQRLGDKDKQLNNQKKQLDNQKKQINNQKKQIENCSKQIEDQNILIKEQIKRMENYSKQLEDQNKLIEIQNIKIENLKKQSINANQENKEITHLKQQVGNINKELKRKIENHETEKHKIKDEIEKLQQNINSMIMPNIDVDPNFTPVSTSFQWKVYVESDEPLVSPPFYDLKNGMCFQLGTILYKNSFTIGLFRYRGKYDHPTNEITTQSFELVVHMIGNNGYFKVVKFSNGAELHIAQSELISKLLEYGSISDEISKFTIDGYTHMHFFFQ